MKTKKQKNYWYVYLTINLITFEMYIGEHGSSTLFDTSYKGSGKILTQKIKEYGFNNFMCVPLEYAKSESEVLDLEEFYISRFNAVEDGMFYNINPRSSVIGDEGRKIMSEKAKLRTHPPTTSGYTWINDSTGNHYVKEEDLANYIDYEVGRKNFIGFGSGADNIHNKRTKEKLDRIIKDNLFYDYFITNGKSKTLAHYKINTTSFSKICDALNISQELQEEVHRNQVKQRYLNRKKPL